MSKGNIQIHACLRPHKESDGRYDPEAIVIKEKRIEAFNVEGRVFAFKLGDCHGAESTQSDVFAQVQPLLDGVFNGVNACVFAYGVTGSGKTHTMEGTPRDPAIIPRAVAAIFQRVEEMANRIVDVEVSFSYVEILIDEVYDLLGDQRRRQKLDVREDETGKTHIVGRIKVPITSAEDFEGNYREASKSRKTASTNLNTSSSRSHAILTIHLDIMEQGERRSNEICFVDLAGSENNKVTGNERATERMRERGYQQVPRYTWQRHLTAPKGAPTRAHRVSRFQAHPDPLPWVPILQLLTSDALGGTSQTLLLVCLAPGEKFVKDTINTLKFADRAGQVVNTINPHRRPLAPRHTAPVVPSRPRVSAVQAPVRRNTFAAPTAAIRRFSVLPDQPAPVAQSRRTALLTGAARVTEAVPDQAALVERDEQRIWGHETVARVARDAAARLNAARATSPTASAPSPSNSGMAALPISGAQVVQPVPAPQDTADGLNEQDKRLRAGAHAKKGRQEQRAGNLELALRHYQSALAIYPDQLKLKQRILEVQMELGQALDASAPGPTPRQPSTLAAGVRRVREEVEGEGAAGQSPPVRRRLEHVRA